MEEYLIVLLLHIPKNHTYVPSFLETILVSENLRQIYVLLVLYLDSISFKSHPFDINEYVIDFPKELLEIVDRLYLTELDEKLKNPKAAKRNIKNSIKI